MKSIWTAHYEGNLITIENNWFSGEKLFVNGELQDYQVNYFSTPILTGHLINQEGNRLSIKANLIQSFFTIKAILFVDDSELELKKLR